MARMVSASPNFCGKVMRRGPYFSLPRRSCSLALDLTLFSLSRSRSLSRSLVLSLSCHAQSALRLRNTVTAVHPGSPAAAAGVEMFDEIVAVDGKQVRTHPSTTLSWYCMTTCSFGGMNT
eukprot:6190318-Pleurochrysis_carterae.AAC.3